MLKKSTFFVTSLGYHNDSHLSTNLNSKAPKIKELQERINENSISINVKSGFKSKIKKKTIFRSKIEKQQWTD